MSTSALKNRTLILDEQSVAIEKKQADFAYRFLLVMLGVVVVSLIFILKAHTATSFLTEPILLFYTIFVTTFQLSRLTAATFYVWTKKELKQRTAAIHRGFYEPTVSFVIPCKNEGATIAKTIHKCFGAHYPKEKLQVIIINDGSTDNTKEVLKEMKVQYPDLVVVNWEKNRGKRHGMAEGFKRATGEIVVQLDSDSYIEPESFYKIIEPFKNPEIGAVCAHADPENADKNILTKMQAAYYFMSFRILKAAESAFMSVFCCSGCSSAYRKSVVLPIMDTWLNEKFLGLPVTWGDDRALTNWVLKLGYKTIYTDDAQAYTICPDNWKVFLKQQVRWKKGWFVNSINATKFILKREPFVALTYFFPLIFITIATPFMALRAFVWNPIVNDLTPFYYVVGVFLISFLIIIFYRFVARENKYWPYLFIWSTINMVFLSFVLFYALATIQNRKWGTR